MENRKIIIVDSSSNQKVVINTDAETFGELKRAARKAGIDSLLPVNVNYKGTITNNLVYMLTNTNKRIKSGIDSIIESVVEELFNN